MKPSDDNSHGDTKTEVDPAIEQLAQQVIGAAIAVHRELGPGFPESVYEQALCIQLSEQGIPHQSQAPIIVRYHGKIVGEGRADILVDQRLVVELKTAEELKKVHTSQVVAYLHALNLRLGLLFNFHVPVLIDGLKRVIL